MRTQTFLIRCEYPDGDRIPTQEFVENIQEYFAANIMDGEKGRLVVKPVYMPKEEKVKCFDVAYLEQIKDELLHYKVEPKTIYRGVPIDDFISLVRRMRDAQKDVIYKSMFSTLDSARPTDYEVAKMKQIVLEQEVDEYLEKMEEKKC